jgi:hypothetical protein
MTAPLPTSGPIKVGDRVYVTDPGLAQLRAIMRQYGHPDARSPGGRL